MSDTSIGARIKAARESAGMTQAGLANAIGVQGQTIWRYEHGETTPGADVLGRIARACGVSSDALLFGDDEPATGTDG